jgi:tubulin alpha
MREVLSVHIGQCGVQIGSNFWELLALEHQIQPDASLKDKSTLEKDDTFTNFFAEDAKGTFTSRSIFVDLEPTTIDEVRKGTYNQIHQHGNLIAGKEDAAHNYARGHFTIGKEVIDKTLDKIRKMTENCSSLQGFLITQALGGGTGSGFGSLLLERLDTEYGKAKKIGYQLFASPNHSTSTVEPYNAVMGFADSMEHLDLSVYLDNKAMYEICSNQLGIERVNYANTNRLIAQSMSSTTSSLRFNGELNVDLRDLVTNLVPYPRLHYVVPTLAPLLNNYKGYEQRSVEEITNEAFNSKSSLVSCKLDYGKFLANSLMYKGDVVPQEINSAIIQLKSKRNFKFVDFIHTGFKCGINLQPPVVFSDDDMAKHSRSLAVLCNTTSIVSSWENIAHMYDTLYRKRAFAHWIVGEGMSESGMFSLPREDLASIIDDYEKIGRDVVEPVENE